MNTRKYICVYCGSSMGSGNAFAEAAAETGRMIARLGLGLSYGGACCGTMGKVADAAMENGAPVHGIIPDFFKDYGFEVIHTGLTELTRVKTMAERKERLIEVSDCFLALPGSYGTLDELFETLVLVQLKQIDKPVFLLNLNGFYDPMLAQLDTMQQCGFLQEENRHLLQVFNTLGELESALRRLV
ncbi:MAG: TIGR00730 family Rossman fold protein [Bacteroides sp.]|nr:TIGR00730 family Rossman fold protein [Bacteroides sp.]